jgi:ubiquinone/menaquinone biosynthesis C-methylase UbiE
MWYGPLHQKRWPVKPKMWVPRFSDDMLHIAQTRLKGLDNVEFKNENWQETTFADETFDTIFSGLVLL